MPPLLSTYILIHSQRSLSVKIMNVYTWEATEEYFYCLWYVSIKTVILITPIGFEQTKSVSHGRVPNDWCESSGTNHLLSLTIAYTDSTVTSFSRVIAPFSVLSFPHCKSAPCVHSSKTLSDNGCQTINLRLSLSANVLYLGYQLSQHRFGTIIVVHLSYSFYLSFHCMSRTLTYRTYVLW